MAKKSQRRPLRYDKDQVGCIWGFISFFDFRHGRLTHRLLSDRSRFTRQIVGVGCSIPSQQIMANSFGNPDGIHESEEDDDIIADASRTSVKELIEEEMIVEKDCEDQIANGENNTRETELEQKEKVKKKRRRRRKSSKSHGDIQPQLSVSQIFCAKSSSRKNSEDTTSRKADLEIVAKDIWQQINQKNSNIVKDDSNNEIDSLLEQKGHVVDTKLSEAIRLFVDRRSKDGKIDCSKEFMDALETLSSNKELIFEMLRDPNSVLVKHIENLEASHLEKDRNTDKTKLLDGELSNLKKRHNYFRRRSKSEEKIRLNGDDNCQTPNRIVILKPGLPFQSPNVPEIGVRNEKTASHFSFTEIKRRLKNAMGKEKNELPANGIAYKIAYERQNSGNSGEKGGWNSPNRNHFYIEKFARPANGIRNKDTISKPKNSRIIINESVENKERRISNMYMEAKRHLSEMLSQEDEIGDLSNRKSPKALGKMISLPGFNFSPLNSPRENENHFITAKPRLMPQSSFHVIDENKSKLTWENDSELCDNSDVLDEHNHTYAEGARSDKNSAGDADSATEKACTDDVAKELEILPKNDEFLKKESLVLNIQDKELQVLDVPAKKCSSSAIEDSQVVELIKACDDEDKLESLEQEQLLCSPSTSISKHIGVIDTANEKLERPSPVSVLEPLFTEDDISPAAEPLIRPLRIQFEEQLSSTTYQEIYASACLDDEESAFEYVEAVLLASDLNIHEFREKWILSSPILDPSLFGEVELFSSRSFEDQKLLFDCTNEVLNEVCDWYFGYIPRVSFVKHNVREIARGMDLIHEIWNGVEWHLLEEQSPRTLDHIIRKDFRKDGKWMKLRFDVESIGFEIGDSIIEELLEDILSNFTNDDREIGSFMLPETLIAIE